MWTKGREHAWSHHLQEAPDLEQPSRLQTKTGAPTQQTDYVCTEPSWEGRTALAHAMTWSDAEPPNHGESGVGDPLRAMRSLFFCVFHLAFQILSTSEIDQASYRGPLPTLPAALVW